VFGAFIAILWSAKPDTYTPAPATAILSIIQAPTITPIPIDTPTPLVTPTSAEGVSQPNGPIAVSDFVQVNGTGGDGLRLHTDPGVSSEVRYVAIESEVFLVNPDPSMPMVPGGSSRIQYEAAGWSQLSGGAKS
jgi:hypothetical protein